MLIEAFMGSDQEFTFNINQEIYNLELMDLTKAYLIEGNFPLHWEL